MFVYLFIFGYKTPAGAYGSFKNKKINTLKYVCLQEYKIHTTATKQRVSLAYLASNLNDVYKLAKLMC